MIPIYQSSRLLCRFFFINCFLYPPWGSILNARFTVGAAMLTNSSEQLNFSASFLRVHVCGSCFRSSRISAICASVRWYFFSYGSRRGGAVACTLTETGGSRVTNMLPSDKVVSVIGTRGVVVRLVVLLLVAYVRTVAVLALYNDRSGSILQWSFVKEARARFKTQQATLVSNDTGCTSMPNLVSELT